MSERITVITGGASGIGFAMAKRFSASGDVVVVADIQEDMGSKAAKEIGGHFCRVDVADEESVNEFFEKVETEIGPIGVLANSVKLQRRDSFCALTELRASRAPACRSTVAGWRRSPITPFQHRLMNGIQVC